MTLTCSIVSLGEILASDGIFDALKKQFALTHVRKALRTTQKAQDAAVAVALLQSGGKMSVADNAAVIMLVFKFPDPVAKRAPVTRIVLEQLEQAAA